MKIPMALAGAVLLASTLGACGGGDGGSGGEDSSYCKDLKKAEKTFNDVSSGSDLGQLDAAFKTFHKLADEAPSDIEKDWAKLDGAIDTVEKALKDAGLTFADLEKIQAGQVPEGVDPSKLQGLASEMTKLSSADFTEASKSIEKHAKKTCKVDLSS